MTKVTMPEPTVWIKTRKSNGDVELCMEGPIKHVSLFDWQPYITTDQAEAYAAAKVREALDWQPIETAPKDGFPVLLFARLESAMASTRVTGHFLNGEWLSQSYIGQGKAVLIPSHWMPLPPPPQHDSE